MAKVTIYSADGTAKYTGCPTFHDTYMGVPYLEFTDVASPVAIDWEVGDYADYERTGRRYWIFDLPQPKRNASSGSTGNAIEYESVKLHGMEKHLELALFSDLVVNDNGIYYSSREETSTYEDVSGIATRMQAIMAEYFEGLWTIAVVDSSYTDIDIDEAREFTIDGCTVLEALERIYEVWPGLGWTTVETVASDGTRTCVLLIGAPNASKIRSKASNPSTSRNTFAYGKGNGLTALKRGVTNADDLCTRLYPFGTEDNMPSRHYNSEDYNGVILNYDSNDIPNVMIPVSKWGTTDDLYDPAKAYIQDDDKVAEYGLRPKKVYFNGDDTEEEIYPTIKGVTAGEIRAAKDELGETEYRPSETEYPDDDEAMDEVQMVTNPSDSGDLEEATGDSVCYMSMSGRTLSIATSSHTLTIKKFSIGVDGPVILYFSGGNRGSFAFTSEDTNITFSYYVSLMRFFVITPNGDQYYGDCTITNNTFVLPSSIYCETGSAGTYTLQLVFGFTSAAGIEITFPAYSITATAIASTDANYFQLTLKQIGFDLSGTSTDSSGLATIVMTSGSCAGREFTARSVTYQEDTDNWLLKMNRVYDDDLDLYFPNSLYPIAAGDTFVLTNIEMPSLYVGLAEQRLLEAANAWYEENSQYLYSYEADIDAKVMEEEGLLLTAGMFVPVADDDVADGGSDYVLVESVTIKENGDGLPTWDVTFRDKSETKVSSAFKARMEAAVANALSAKATASKVSTSTLPAVALAAAVNADGYVSRAEIPTLTLVLTDIINEFQDLLTEAILADVSVDAYVEAYSAAVSALNKYTTFIGSAKEIEDDYDNIAAYYAARTTLKNSLSTAE